MRRSVFRGRNSWLKPGFSRAGIALAAIVAVALGMRILVPGALVAVVAPVASLSAGAMSAIGVSEAIFAGPVALKATLNERDQYVMQLEEQNRALAARAADLTTLLGTRTEAPDGVVAGVLMRPPESPYDTLIVDAGERSGVTADARALGPGGTPIGTVASVTSSSARVVLYSAPGHEVMGFAGEKRVPITLVGIGGGAFTATAPRDAAVVVGDTVFILGPGALPFGTVLRIDSDATTPVATLSVRPYTNPFSLTWITIVPALSLP